MIEYWLVALAWFLAVLVRTAYLRGRGDFRGAWDTFQYAFNWGVVGGCLWPAAIPFTMGWRAREGL